MNHNNKYAIQVNKNCNFIQNTCESIAYVISKQVIGLVGDFNKVVFFDTPEIAEKFIKKIISELKRHNVKINFKFDVLENHYKNTYGNSWIIGGRPVKKILYNAEHKSITYLSTSGY